MEKNTYCVWKREISEIIWELNFDIWEFRKDFKKVYTGIMQVYCEVFLPIHVLMYISVEWKTESSRYNTLSHPACREKLQNT